MVFESLVAEILNKYLGEYVDNLDRSQLKIGIWRGDVVLKDLSLKQTALADLQLPVRTINGFLGKLILKIPWKNLYNESVEATVEDLYLLVAPNTEVDYNPIKEEKWRQQAKQAAISTIEEAKKSEQDKVKPNPNDTFTEKLATQIVRNVQIFIKNIHIRYEDRVNNVGKPFSLGITLSKLIVTTTDKNWRCHINTDATSMIYKILEIDGLSVYWNPKDKESFLEIPTESLEQAFKEGIATKNVTVNKYQYLLGPINAISQLTLNTKPEMDGYNFKHPKVLLRIKLENLQIKISKSQYQDLMVLLDSMERMSRAAPYRRYRPAVPTYKGYYKQWWKFAFQCILEEEIRRRRRNWDWLHILAHRHLCREYANAYRKKLSTNKPSKEVVDTCERCEASLDVLNIVLVRQQIEVEMIRQESHDQLAKQQQSGWFSGWWGRNKQEDASTKTTLMKQFETAMTPAEKEKLYQAIGYQANSAPTQYPVEFVDIDLNFSLNSLELKIKDDKYHILSTCFNHVNARFEQRPAGKAFKLSVTLHQFFITGVQQGHITPVLVQTQSDQTLMTPVGLTSQVNTTTVPLLDIIIEMNPLDSSCDQRIHVISRPLHIVYDALTINKVVDVFTVEQSAFISHLQTAANEKLTEFKTMSALRLQYALEQQSVLDLKVHLMGFYGVLAHGGHYTGTGEQALVVANFGQILINSKPRVISEINVKQLQKKGIADKEIKSIVREQGYDCFSIELRSVQLQMVLPGEKWTIYNTKASEQCLLSPTNFEAYLAKSRLPDEPDNPRIKINATLPAIHINIAERRLLGMIGLLVSIPFPVMEEKESQLRFQRYGSFQSINKVLEITRATKVLDTKKFPLVKKDSKKTIWPVEVDSDDLDFSVFDHFRKFVIDEKEREKFNQFTNLLIKFNLNEVSVCVFHKSDDNKEIPLVDFHVLALEASLEQNTYDQNIDVRLGGLSLNQNFQGSKVNVINTPMAEGKEEYLLTVKYLNANKDSPVFESYHNSVVQWLDFNFTQLNILIHQEAFLDVIQWVNKLQGTLNDITTNHQDKQKKPSRSTTRTPSKIQRLPSALTKSVPAIRLESTSTEYALRASKKNANEKLEDRVIELLLKAVLGEIKVTLRNSTRLVAAIDINGGSAVIISKRSSNTFYAKLINFELIDLCANTKYPKVLSVVGSEEAFQTSLIMYNLDVLKQPQHLNMSVQLQIARFQVVFLNYFVLTLLDFTNQFSDAQAVIMEASAAAAEVAKDNMQQVYKEAYRISLVVKLKAPIILVPTNSLSLDALMIDFGVLTLKNVISELELPTTTSSEFANQPKSVIDTLNIDLQNLKVSRITLKSTKEVETENIIVQPVSFSFVVIRNLCPSYFKEIPDIDIRGRLESIHVVLSQEDYIKIMTVISQNLGEVPPTPVQTQSLTNFDSSSKLKLTEAIKINLTAENEYSMEEKETEPVWTIVKFSFTLKQLVIELFEAELSNKDVRNGVVYSLQRNNGLACFTLIELSIKGSLLSDNTLTSSIVLRDCWLDDTRDSRYKIWRYMERKSNDTAGRQYMIDITFLQKGNVMFVGIETTSFILIINIEHLLKVADLFVSAQEQPPKSTNLVIRQSKMSNQTETTYLDVVETDPDRNITITLKVFQPDIILVERMDLNTNAIILNNEIDAKVTLTGPLMNIMATINDLQLFSCCFDPARRKETKAEILRPVTINLLGSTPSGKGLHVEISTTNIRVRVTPGTIELLNSVLMSLTVLNKQDEAKEEEQEKDYSDIWAVKNFIPEDYWFLNTAEGDDTGEVSVTNNYMLDIYHICLVRVPSMVITLEAGVSSKTLPMLLLESSLHARIHIFDYFIKVESTMYFQMSYYNSSLALWEPLVEPVEKVRPEGGTLYIPWELQIHIETNDSNKADRNDSVEVEILNNNKPKTVLIVTSKETMDITVTKTCLDVLKTLASSFNKAIYEPETKAIEALAPYIVQNDLGIDVTLSLTKDDFVIYDPSGKQISIKDVVLETRAKVNLSLAEEEPDVRSMVSQMFNIKEKFLQFKFQVSDRFYELETSVTRADKCYLSLKHRGANNDTWGIVSDVQVINGSTIITLRGIIQIQNHFNTPVRVFFTIKKGTKLEYIGVVEPQNHLNLPLQSIYTPTNELFFSIEGYSVSHIPFVWKDLQKSLIITKILQCNANNTDNKEPFFIKAVGEIEQVNHELTNRHTMASTCYNIHLRPTVILKNFLPVDVIVSTENIVGESELKSGQRMQIVTAQPGNTSLVIRIHQYLNKDWSCKREIPANPTQLSVWTFKNFEGAESARAVLNLGMQCVNDNGSFKFSLYCPFWMINKTGLMLSYRKYNKPENEEDVFNNLEQTNDNNIHYHPPHFKGPIMLSFRAKSFYGKKKSSIKVKKGEWSKRFSLDVAGSSGIVECKADNMIYQIGVHIQLTSNTLTKQVTFTPYYILVNHCPIDVEVLEINGSSKTWIKVESNAVSPFWPETKVSHNKSAELMMRLAGSSETTKTFPYNRIVNCLLKLQNKYGAVKVDVQKTEGATYIAFGPYMPGLAPALIINHSLQAIPLEEKDTNNSITLNAGQKILFNWSTTKENLVLTWDDKNSSDLRKDEVGEFTIEPNAKLFWVTFLDGMQRILLFTSNLDIAHEAEVAHQFEVSNLEVQAHIHGIGISLVDNEIKQEILYVGITSSGVMWENRKVGSKRYKVIAAADSVKIEEAYSIYKQELILGNTPISKCAIGDNIVVDFATNEMLRPHTCELRRTYQQGLWAVYRSSLNQWQLHIKLNRLQMDNQSFDCVFPVVFSPVPPPKSVSMDNVMKPFAELSLVQRINIHTVVQQVKYFKVLVQEFHVKLDIGFINALIKMFEASTTSDEEEETLFVKDINAVDESLIAHVTLMSSQEQKNFYDYIHFSPLKIHVSFSLSGGGMQSTQSVPTVLNVLMQSLGVTLTDLQDVVFKLSYFERMYTAFSQKQLTSEVILHYQGQLLKQLYVLVLGLDVLGNPFGLVIGIKEGVHDLFYEPFQGAIQGPGEFCEGLLLGVRSLFGHTVGGAAGAVSRITGVMGKGLAALTFDEDYQRKRRELMNTRPTSVPQGLALSGKGLVMGVVEGVGGAFSKPISGAKEEGVEGFIKGMGKGMIGLVTHPTTGVIDFASGSLNVVKRATELSKEVTRLRDPRCFKADNLVRPYCRLESEGNRILRELEKGKYYTTDEYAYHTTIGNAKCRDILLLTDKRLLLLSQNDIFGGYQVEFTHIWGELIGPPVLVSIGVEIKTGLGRKKLFRSNEQTRIIVMEGEDLKKYVIEKMNNLMFPPRSSSGRSSLQSTLS